MVATGIRDLPPPPPVTPAIQKKGRHGHSAV
jgi:hypothetical protein